MNTINALHPKISVGLTKMADCKDQIRELQRNKDAINKNKNFTRPRTVEDVEKRSVNHYTTTCFSCVPKRTCHKNCAIGNDLEYEYPQMSSHLTQKMFRFFFMLSFEFLQRDFCCSVDLAKMVVVRSTRMVIAEYVPNMGSDVTGINTITTTTFLLK